MTLNEAQIALRMETLPDRYADRLTPRDLQAVTEYRDVGEWLFTVQSLVAGLRAQGARITQREQTELHQYLAAFEAADQVGRLEARLTGLTQSITMLTVS